MVRFQPTDPWCCTDSSLQAASITLVVYDSLLLLGREVGEFTLRGWSICWCYHPRSTSSTGMEPSPWCNTSHWCTHSSIRGSRSLGKWIYILVKFTGLFIFVYVNSGSLWSWRRRFWAHLIGSISLVFWLLQFGEADTHIIQCFQPFTATPQL